MKKIFLLATLSVIVYAPSLWAQDKANSSTLSPILSAYYGLKDALIAGNADDASAKAGEMLQALNGVDMKSLSPKEHKAFMSLQTKLAFDARHISEKKDIDHQREHFAALSSNMYALAKASRLSADPIYREYCPMKKSYWLSREQVIKNPYFGEAMLSCGKVAETLKP